MLGFAALGFVGCTPEFAYVRDDIERYRKEKDEKTVSLNEKKRLAEKKIDPLITHTFPLLEARKALELLATGSVGGKIVLINE